MKLDRALARAVLLAAALASGVPSTAETPHLRQQGSAKQLVVGGEPFLVIGGELSNSAASSEAFMAPHWPRLRAMHVNTVLAPVSWELVEPEEGRFDWSSVDSMLRAARANDLKLVLLWFGAWKNSMSTYAPSWVKRDQSRFPRAATPDGRGVDILSPFGAATLAADSRAFAALMAHLRAVDGDLNTVIMVQVENEIGMLPVVRDYSPAANAAFGEPVPRALVDYLVAHRDALVPGMQRMWLDRGARTSGSWNEVFGEGDAGAEVFTAWHFARFADRLAQAGKAEYPLPMYVNVALNRPGRRPGEYPSGGPLPHLLDVWKAGAPSYDFVAPDIYFSNFVEIVAQYHRPDNALFIPEGHNADNPTGPANAVYAIGAHDALGFAPFSIDSIDEVPGGFASAYGMLDQLAPFIVAAQGTGRMMGFKPAQAYDESLDFAPDTATIGDYRFTVSYGSAANPQTPGYGAIIIQTGPEDYLIAGQGVTVTFEPVNGGSAGIDKAWEGRFENGAWQPRRLLNGDQTHQGRHIALYAGEWKIQQVRLYTYR